MDRPKFYFENMKKKEQKSPTEITKRQYNFKTGHYRQKKVKVCPECNGTAEKLTTDHWGNPMCSTCFISSLD